ncbi:hypothetical protein ACT3CD_15885 [Geofilum sp. OHC36d9]|uniref:hypothetical protein n=1 Tax=Geofilum sp. OHC36d9 TaxID=3458413 RepID=UPI0040342761
MKNFALNRCNVVCLEDTELKETNGGAHGVLIGAAIALLICCWDDRDGFVEGFKKGYSAG